VVRVIDVPAACTLGELHELLQAGIGWTDSHLHEFQTSDGRRYGVLDDEDGFDDPGPPLADETTAGLRELGEQAVYLYDFGDNWTHDVHPAELRLMQHSTSGADGVELQLERGYGLQTFPAGRPVSWADTRAA
jgi:hypothetical protein